MDFSQRKGVLQLITVFSLLMEGNWIHSVKKNSNYKKRSFQIVVTLYIATTEIKVNPCVLCGMEYTFCWYWRNDKWRHYLTLPV